MIEKIKEIIENYDGNDFQRAAGFEKIKELLEEENDDGLRTVF